MDSTLRNLILLVILACSQVSTAKGNCWFSTKWTVYITNGMSNDITTHVKSKDDDLGSHVISPGGNYRWRFCERFDGRTLYWAGFSWGAEHTSFTVFDKRIARLCTVGDPNDVQPCYWLVRTDGFYLSANNSAFPNGWKKVNSW